MPTYSDDGKWWWDGRAWQPVTQQPPAPQQQQYPGPQQPAQPQYGAPQQHPGPQQPYPPQQHQPQPQYPGGQPSYPSGPQGFYQPQQPPKKSRTVLLLVAGAVVLVLVLAVGGVAIWKNTSSDKDGGTAAGAPPKDAKTIEPGQPVTEQALSEVNAQAFHESVMKRQMLTPLGRLKTSVFGDARKFATGQPIWSITDMAVDRQSKKYYYAQTILDGLADKEPTNSVCTGDPKPMVWSNYSKAWQRSTFDELACTKMSYQGGGDSIVSTGLTAEQADKVIAYFRSSKGFVNAARPTLLTTGGKTYVRQVVDFKPVERADNNYWGSAILMWGLRDAGIDPVEWKWSNPFNLTEGIHMVYYLDPTTLLPVAAFQSGIDTPASGSEPAVKRTTIQVINYSYPTALPEPKFGNSPNTLTISLPEGWKAQ